MQLVKIMHDGYPNRCRFDEMLRFRGSALALGVALAVAVGGSSGYT